MMLLARDSLHEFQLIKTALDTSFKIKDLGTLKYFLGLEVAHSTLGISLHLKKLRKTLKAEMPRMEQRIQKWERHMNICMSDESWIILKGSYARWRFVWVDIGTDRWRLHSQCFP